MGRECHSRSTEYALVRSCTRQPVTLGSKQGLLGGENMPGWSMMALEYGAGAQRGRAHWVSVRTQTRPSSPNKQIPQMSLRFYTAGEFPKVERWSWGPDGGSQLSMQNVLTTTSLSSSRFLLMVVDFPSHLCTCTRTPPSRVMMLCRHGKRDYSVQMKAKNMIENMEPWLKGIFWGPYAKWQEYSPTRKRKKETWAWTCAVSVSASTQRT